MRFSKVNITMILSICCFKKHINSKCYFKNVVDDHKIWTEQNNSKFVYIRGNGNIEKQKGELAYEHTKCHVYSNA